MDENHCPSKSSRRLTEAADLIVRRQREDMRRMLTLSVFVLVLFVLSAARAPAAIDDEDETGYPLTKGNYWVYRGKAKWVVEGTTVVEKQPTVKVEMLDVIKRGHLTAAVMKGAPGDYRTEKTEDRTDHLIIRAGKTMYYNLHGDRIKMILKRIKDPKDHLGRLLGEEEEPYLDLPLLTGKVFGDPEQVTRLDLFYCWTVLKEEEVDLSVIKGLEPVGKRRQFTLRYITLPDEIFIDFVPGVGVTGYRFKHHGTVDEADLKLVEAKIGTANK